MRHSRSTTAAPLSQAANAASAGSGVPSARRIGQAGLVVTTRSARRSTMAGT